MGEFINLHSLPKLRVKIMITSYSKSFLTLKLDGPADEPWVGLHGSDPHLRRVVGEEPGGDVDVLAADEDPDGVLADERRGELAGERPVAVGSDLRGAAAAVGALIKGIQLMGGRW